MEYLKRTTQYSPISLDPGEVITIADAARLLGVSIPTVTIRVQKGLMTQIIDSGTPNPRNGRSLLLRSEVETWRRQRASRK